MCKATHAFHLKKELRASRIKNIWEEILTSNMPYQRHIIKNNKATDTKTNQPLDHRLIV
jgi:hypothetical protein